MIFELSASVSPQKNLKRKGRMTKTVKTLSPLVKHNMHLRQIM